MLKKPAISAQKVNNDVKKKKPKEKNSNNEDGLLDKKNIEKITVKERSSVNSEDCWNVEALFTSIEAWEKAFQSVCNEKQQPHWPELANLKGTLKNSPQALKTTLETFFNIQRQLSHLYTYAHLRHDEDISNSTYKSAFARITAILYDLSQEISWFEPELLTLPDDTLKAYLESSSLSPYRFYLEKIVRLKKYTLSEKEERLMALTGLSLEGFYKAFKALTDADFQFDVAIDAQGTEKPLSHALYGLYIRDKDRTLRKNAFQRYHKRYQEYENTLCELLTGLVRKHQFNSKARGYASCLEAALYPLNIDKAVYHSLIKAVNDNLGVLHRYQKLRKEILGVDQLHLYDVYVPLFPQLDTNISYTEAEQLVIDSVEPLGNEYQDLLRTGLQKQRWVDRYENKNKRSGAYSSGSYDTMPYILMNYKGTIRDLFVLAHEAGHSMHSLLSHKNQPYHDADYSIFVAEVASTFNEELLMQLMLQRSKNRHERAYLINQKIEDIRATLFRQTMFAEFELAIHTFVEEGRPLTPELLKEEHFKLNKKYFGPDIVIDPEIQIEWARIPHFYANFYVYQYATGISAALSLAEKIVKGGEKERDAYLDFLKMGGSCYPIDALKSAGVDMRSPLPVESAIKQFSTMVDRLTKEI